MAYLGQDRSRRRPFLFPAILVAAALLLPGGGLPGGPGAAQASILIALDLPTLVQEADHIAVVEVASVKAAWDEGHERIYSTIELNVIENWKAPAPAGAAASSSSGRLTIVQAGGTVGDMTMTVSGMGTFAPGERSLVFLRGPANRARVVGMTQGKRAMRYQPSSKSWTVFPPDLRQTKLVRPPVGRAIDPARLSSSPAQPPSAPQAMVPAAVNSRELPLEDLRAEIKRLLGARAP